MLRGVVASTGDRNAIDLYHFTRKLSEVLDDEGRYQAVRMMWRLFALTGSQMNLKSTSFGERRICWGCHRDNGARFANGFLADSAPLARVGAGRPQAPACLQLLSV